MKKLFLLVIRVKQRLWIPSTTKIIKSRDVRFIEDIDDKKIGCVDILII